MKLFPAFPHFFHATKHALSERERWLVVGCVFLFLVGVVWAAVVFVHTHTELIPAEGGVYREGMVGEPRYINPILARTNDVDMALSRIVYSGLMKLSTDGTLEGDLADHVDISADGKTYTAVLREGMKWQDGQPITTDDVLFTYRAIQSPDTKSPSAPSFQGVTIQKVDDRTMTFTLRDPYGPFLYNLMTGVVPEHIWSSVDLRNMSLAEQNLKPIGSGPFQFKKLHKRSLGDIVDIELERNESYFGNPPHLNGMIFTFYPQYDDMIRAYQKGSLDGMGSLRPSLLPGIERMHNTTVYKVELPQYFAMFFNETKNTLLSDSVVRASLDLGVDRERLIADALKGTGIRADTPIPAGFLGYLDTVRRVSYDPEKAKQNLEEAGWKDTNNDGIREKDGKPLHFTLSTTDSPEYVQTASILADNWKTIGVDVTIDSRSIGSIQSEVIRPRNYDALLYGEVLGADPDPYPFWHSTQTRDPGLNLALYRDKDADKLLEKARKTTDTAERGNIYQQFQEHLVESTPAIFLYSPLSVYVTRSNVHGTMLGALPLPSERFTTISTWYIRTKRIWKK